MKAKTLLLATIAIVPALYGQAQAQPDASTASAGSTVGEVIVTAQKRQENVQKVGMSIQTATGEKLSQLGITDPSQLTKIVPGFNYLLSTYGTPIFAIRGVSFQTPDLNASPAVSVYTDEVPLPYSSMTTGAALDVQRVEVLKGPQGTLYGENSTGGAVNFISNKPTDKLKAGVDVSYGRFNAVDFQGFVSGPIAPTLDMRLAFHTAQSGPWQYNYNRDAQLGRQDLNNGRLLLLWKPTSSFKALFSASGFIDRSETQAPQLYAIAPAFAGAVPDPRISSYPLAPKNDRAADWGACVNDSGLYPNYNALPAPYGYDPPRPAHSTDCTNYRQDNKQYALSLRLDYEITPDITLTSLTSHEQYDRVTPLDETGMIYSDYQTLQTGQVVHTAEEIRLAGKVGTIGDWIVGGNYEMADDRDDYIDDYANSTYSPALGLPLYGDRIGVKSTVRQWAVFANGDMQLSQNLKLVGGVRYTEDKQTAYSCTNDAGDGDYARFSQAYQNYAEMAAGYITAAQYADGGPGLTADAAGGHGYGVNVGPYGCAIIGPGPTFNPITTPHTLDENNVSWRAGLDWQVQPRTLLYVLISKGYKSGSFPAVSATLYSEFKAAKQESLLSYEIGLKKTWAGGSLVTDLAAYYYEYNNKQIVGDEFDPVFGFEAQLVNVPHSHIIGVEASGTWRPEMIPGLVVTPSVNFTYSRIDGCSPSDDSVDSNSAGLPGCYSGLYHNIDTFGGLATYTGKNLPNAPQWQADIDAQYDWQVRSYGAYVGMNVSYQSMSTGAPIAPTSGYPENILNLPAYALLDLRAGVTKDTWRFELFGRNVTNTYYWNNALHAADVLVRYTGRPATYGVRLAYRFN